MKKSINMIRIFALILTSVVLGSCASLYVKNGKEAYDNLQYHDAIYFLEKGVAKKDEPDARRKLAESYLKINNFEKAQSTYELTTTYTDNSDTDRINYAKALMGVEKYSEAKTILEGRTRSNGMSLRSMFCSYGTKRCLHTARVFHRITIFRR